MPNKHDFTHQQSDNQDKTIKNLLIIYLKGMAMGAADIVPGVSGGTIALIAGIYERLINALSNFNPSLVTFFFSHQKNHGIKQAFTQIWHKTDATFLLCLLLGIGTSFITLAGLIHYLIEFEPLKIWSFFFGLVVATVWLLLKEIPKWTFWRTILFLLGLSLAVLISSAPLMTTEPSLWFLFLAGALAICAMILPGISGSFILLLLGVYDVVLKAIHDFNITVLLTVVFGMATGLLSFTHLLKWLLSRYYQATLSVLVGFIAGSLVKLYPWKVTQGNVLPWEFPTGAHWITTLSLMALGAGVVTFLSWISNQQQKSQP